MEQAAHQVTRHVYEPVLWKSFVREEQIKRPISLRIQFPNCDLYLELKLCFLWKNGKVVLFLTLLVPSYFGPTLYTKRGIISNLPPTISHQPLVVKTSNFVRY